jgi:hypothetical protein
MKEAAASDQRNTPLPEPTDARRQMQRRILYHALQNLSSNVGTTLMKGSAFMIIRQLKEKQFNSLHNSLMMKAHAEPLEASYTVNMAINGAEYAVKVRPEHHNKMAMLQALRIYREEYGPNFELITRGNILSSLPEILIYQGVTQ